MKNFIYTQGSEVSQQYFAHQQEFTEQDEINAPTKFKKEIQKINTVQVIIKPQAKESYNEEQDEIIQFDDQQEIKEKEIGTNTFKKVIQYKKNSFQKESGQEKIYTEKEYKEVNCQQDYQQEFQEKMLQKEGHIIVPANKQQFQEQQLKLSPQCKRKNKILSIQARFQVQRILFFPQKFHLYIDQKHKLTARRKIVHSNCLYFFFTDIEDLSTKSKHYVGYMQSNYQQTQYSVFNNQGLQLALITYVMKQKKAPQIRIFIPTTYSIKDNILQRYRQSDKNILNLYSKEPKYDPVKQKFKLNFKGRAKMSSMKNCVIQFQNEYSLIIGKEQEKLFNLDFGYPFSELTAFAFAVSNYADKVSR